MFTLYIMIHNTLCYKDNKIAIYTVAPKLFALSFLFIFNDIHNSNRHYELKIYLLIMYIQWRESIYM